MNELKQKLFADSIFRQIGGKKKVNKIVNHFYHVMDTDSFAKECRQLHPEDLSSANEKLKLFLYGWLGGPQTFTKKYGHPRLRQRHFPFKVSTDTAQQWLYCMNKSLEHEGVESAQKEMMMSYLGPLAQRIVNC